MQEQARADAAESALREQSAAALDQQKQWSAAVAGIGEGSEQLELELAQTQQALADARQEIMCAGLGSPLNARLPLNLRSQPAAKAEAANAPPQCRSAALAAPTAAAVGASTPLGGGAGWRTDALLALAGVCSGHWSGVLYCIDPQCAAGDLRSYH